MKISLISFTKNGANLGHLLSKFLTAKGEQASASTVGQLHKSLKAWTKEQFETADGIVFIGATGIAVRVIASFLEDKCTDPAVLVIDEKGQYVIPLVSGHIGGANALAEEIAAQLGAIPIITTATDIHNKFAVDLFAKRNAMYISRMDYAKAISASILNEKQVGFESDFKVKGPWPDNITHMGNCEYGICISLDERRNSFEKTLVLIPKIITIGIGCRRGKRADEIEQVVLEILGVHHLSPHSIFNVTSIDLKMNEAGLLEFCHRLDLELITYSAETMDRLQGIYSESDYVKSVTGIGNVCERAAMLGSDNGIMIQKKYAKNGITVSIARRDWSVKFE